MLIPGERLERLRCALEAARVDIVDINCGVWDKAVNECDLGRARRLLTDLLLRQPEWPYGMPESIEDAVAEMIDRFDEEIGGPSP